MLKLCVNIDHVATLRQARGGVEPDPVEAAVLCEQAGAYGITFHLREDRRHIQDKDVKLLKERIRIKLNMEMANTEEMVGIASSLKPDQVTLVPEKRLELTTEGGLDVAGNLEGLTKTVKKLQEEGISVSLFIDPSPVQVEASKISGAKSVELHTGEYANAADKGKKQKELERVKDAAVKAHALGLIVYAGHGLNYSNTQGILSVPHIEELNTGHSIISRSVFTGITEAVKEMLRLLKK